MLQRSMRGKPLVYLDSAATAQKPRRVIEAMHRFYLEEYGTVHRAVYELAQMATEKYSAVRTRVQKFLNASSHEEILFTKGTTEGINLVASSFGRAFVQPGDEVLITEMEHHSNIVPWQMLCQERGAILKVIPIDDQAQLLLDRAEALISEKTRIVAVAHVANATGTLNPVETLIEMAHRKGAKVLVDGAQSAPHLRVDVQKMNADFFLFSGHKAYGPTGVGVLYGKRELLEAMPPYQGGGDMIEQVTLQQTSYQRLPLKFEAGTPMIAQILGLGEAIQFLEATGLEQIAKWEQGLIMHAMAQLEKIDGLRFIGRAAQRGPIVSFLIGGVHPLDIGTLLDLKGVALRTGHQCAQPTMQRFGTHAVVRASFGMYNTLEEVDLLVTALKEVLLLLHPSLSY